jgi:hypothetical protein
MEALVLFFTRSSRLPQTDLVPELAIRFISKDIGVGEEEVRKIMKDSIGIGGFC